MNRANRSPSGTNMGAQPRPRAWRQFAVAWPLLLPWAWLAIWSNPVVARADDIPDAAALERAFQPEIRPLLKKFCQDCHGDEKAEAEIDLSQFAAPADARKHLRVWQRVGDMLDSRQMPPEGAKQPSDDERAALQQWVRGFLTTEAAARAGDPGRVVLRRLNNVEYTYTLRDLTHVGTLDPAREFPVDGAAGEGFTNTGNALVMSPALATKYLDAAKDVAAHAVLLPDGFRFSEQTSRRDWTEECLAKIRAFYARETDATGGTAVNLQGIQFDTNQGGRLPVEKYLAATLEFRDQLTSGQTTLAAVARDRGLNLKYLTSLWEQLTTADAGSVLIDRLRAHWQAARPADAPALAAEIALWQTALWKFNPVGHIGKHLGRLDGPQSWMEAVQPLVSRQDFRIKLAPAAGEQEVTIYLSASDASDGNEADFVVWENPRLVAPGRTDLALRDVRAVVGLLAEYRQRVSASAARCLDVAARLESAPDKEAVVRLADENGVEPEILAAWFEYLGIGAGEAPISAHLTQKMESIAGYDFVKGWYEADALSVVANSSDEQVRIPGNMKPHGVAVHPSPSLRVIVGWRSPVEETIRIEGVVQHAHPECGNGITWTLELRRGNSRQRLASGNSQGATPMTVGPIEDLGVRPGDVVSLSIGPRDGNHSCDLTAVDLSLKAGDREWNLAGDISPDIMVGNPHADRFGNDAVWHFFSEPDSGAVASLIPAGSLLAHWQSTPDRDEKVKLAEALQQLLQTNASQLAPDAPDALLFHQLNSLTGPFLSAVRDKLLSQPRDSLPEKGDFGLDPRQFGTHPKGAAVDERSLCVQAPQTLAIKLPADLVEGCEFVTSGTLHNPTGLEGSVQLQVLSTAPANHDLAPGLPVLVSEGSAARRGFESAFDQMRGLFPAALCYSKIVPVDEVVTLTLYYREDDQLCRLMLDDPRIAELDRLWDELLYISQEPFLLATAFEQISEFATQDRPDMVKAFAPMRGPMNDRVNTFKQRLIDTEPGQLDALLAFAASAYRRPLTNQESRQLRSCTPVCGRMKSRTKRHFASRWRGSWWRRRFCTAWKSPRRAWCKLRSPTTNSPAA